MQSRIPTSAYLYEAHGVNFAHAAGLPLSQLVVECFQPSSERRLRMQRHLYSNTSIESGSGQRQKIAEYAAI